MIPNIEFNTATCMLKFQSPSELKKYLKQTLEENVRELDRVEQLTGMLMREGKIDGDKPTTKGWVKLGAVFINKLDPEKAMLDSLFALTKEIKPRIVQTQEALKTVEKLSDAGIGHEDAVFLYLRLGLPERFVVAKADEPTVEKFKLDATFSAVDLVAGRKN